MKAFIYTRVSTTRQVDEGVSLEAQKQKARRWALGNDAEIVGEFSDEGISGKRASNRPGLQAALDAVCTARGVLVVYSLSRLARSTKDAILIAERLEKAGADLVSLSEKIDTSSAAGKLFFRMMAALAEFERDVISERTRAAMNHKREKGERIGEVPYGFRSVDGQLIPYDSERVVLREISRMREDGASFESIACHLNARNVRTKKGRAWSWATVRNAALANG